ncbi:MAG TPA: IPT/TIG domain-containing protein, partial [Candidatus Polarisedimenticolia bacterium]|nr:IPT/TIG domain-containing protein [Candidatus Polarisedimenticolia bacterium]
VSISTNAALPTAVLGAGLLVGGTVLDGSGASRPVINVNLDAIDTVTGQSLFLSHDRSDLNGLYSLAIPPGTYRFEYKPEKCPLSAVHLLPQESGAFPVAADLTLPTVTLAPGALVRGVVTDTRGTPVFDVNTSWLIENPPNSGTYTPVLTVDDHTNASGAYSVVIPPGTFNIEYAPPLGMRLAGFKNYGVGIAKDTILSNVRLRDAFLVTGRTATVGGTPLSGIDLDFFIAGTTNKIYTPHDVTDAAGDFTVAVEPGTYDVRFEPPSTTTLAAKRLLGRQVSADLPLQTVTIIQGYVVTGRLTDATGLPVWNADLDFFDAHTHVKAETLHDNTDALGNYSVIVPPALYDVHFVPPNPNALLPDGSLPPPLETVRLPGVSITANMTGLNAVLRSAVVVSGRVKDSLSQVVPGVDLNFYDSLSGTFQMLSRDTTAADGTFGISVPPGNYDVVFTPPPTATGLAQARIGGVAAVASLDLGDVFLGPSLLPLVGSIAPGRAPSTGGVAVTISGSNFQPGAAATLGGLNLLDIQVLGPTQISAVAPSCPVGAGGAVVDLAVANIGAPAFLLPQSFTYDPAATLITLTLTRTSPNIILSWPSTGQAFYTIYRSTSPGLFGQAQVLAIAGSTAISFTDVGADADGVNYFYRVE